MIETRFGDLDLNQHINNVALVGIAEECRVRFHRACSYDLIHDDISSMVASFSIDFLGQAYYPGTLETHAAVTHMGRTSHAVDQLFTQNGRIVAYAQSIIVSTRDERPVEIPAAFRESVEPWMLRE